VGRARRGARRCGVGLAAVTGVFDLLFAIITRVSEQLSAAAAAAAAYWNETMLTRHGERALGMKKKKKLPLRVCGIKKTFTTLDRTGTQTSTAVMRRRIYFRG